MIQWTDALTKENLVSNCIPLIAQWVRQRPWLAASIAGAAGGIAGIAGGIAAAASAASGSYWAAYLPEEGTLNTHYAVGFC